jgi:hypothetical protein
MALYPFNPNYGQRIQGEAGGGSVDMAFLAHYQEAPDAVSTTYVHDAITLTSEPQTITTDITNPDVPRTLTVTGSQAGITGDVVITGTDAAGNTITDTIALNGTATVEGVRAFKTVTSIQVPAQTNPSGDAVSVGVAKTFGLPHVVYNAACLLVKLFDGSTDAGTLTVDAEVSKNLYSLAGTPDGAKVLDLFYIV